MTCHDELYATFNMSRTRYIHIYIILGSGWFWSSRIFKGPVPDRARLSFLSLLYTCIIRTMRINANTVLTKRGDDGKVALVPYTSAHVPRYHQWMASDLLREMTASEPLSLDEEYAMCTAWQNDDDKLTFIVVDLGGWRADNDADDVRHMVGDVNCFFNNPDDPLDNVEVEVMIAEPTARRKGFASEALSLIMQYCVNELGVKGFRAQILRKNEGSKLLFQGLGFRFSRSVDVFDEEVWVRGSVGLEMELMKESYVPR